VASRILVWRAERDVRTVLSVTHDWMIAVSSLDSDLVRSTRLELDFQPRAAGKACPNFVVEDGAPCPGMFLTHNFSASFTRDFAHVVLPSARLGGDIRLDDRPVRFLDRAILELLR